MSNQAKREPYNTTGPIAPDRNPATLEEALEALRRCEKVAQRYRHIVDDVNDGIFELNRDGYFTFVNKVIVERSGFPEPQFPSLHFRNILLPEDHDRASAAFGKILAGETMPPIEVRRMGADGQTIPFELNITPIYDGETIVGIRGITRNLAERKRMEAEITLLNEDLERRVIDRTAQLEAQIAERIKAEEALAESEKKFRNFMETAPIGICIADLSGHVQFVNRKIEEACGWTREELLGRDALTGTGFFDDETLQILLARLDARLKGDAPRLTEVPVMCRDGSSLWIDLKTTILYEDGQPSGLQMAFINITDRKKAEAALKESETRYRELVNLLPLSLFEIDQNGDIISGNPTIFETFGYVPADMEQGLNAFRMIAPEDQDRAISVMHRIFLGEKTGGTEYTAIRKNGQRFPIMIFASSIIRNDIPIGLRGAIIDLTEQKKSERDLQQARDLLLRSEKMASIGRLSTAVAHEILNPVNIISMELQLIQNTEGLAPGIVDELRVCHDQIERIVTIAEHLKELYRIPAKKISPNDINSLIDRVITFCAPQFRLEGVQTDIQYQQDLPALLLDREKIEQVLLNVISNAVYAMATSSRKVLQIRTSREDSAENLSVVRISVADTGTGIPTGDIPKLFDPFFTTKDYGKGSGLGLAISYGIIQDHGGRIWAENNEWGGASFFFELPVHAEGNG